MTQCFFFLESDEKKSTEGTIRSLCLECGNKLRIKGSWFYDGQIGPWTLKCHECNKTIHFYEGDNENEKT